MRCLNAVRLELPGLEKAVFPGRNNYMFMGSEGGGVTAAIAFTVIETAKLDDIDPQAWLADLLSRIGTHPDSQIEHLLPWNHKA